MIVDTSVLIAVLFDEIEREAFLRILASAPTLSMSAGSWLELNVVLIRRGRSGLIDPAEALLVNFDTQIIPVSLPDVRLARDAYARFGRGTGHAAKLNFGDCFAYALAKATGESLLFKGDGFSQTGIEPAA